MAPKRPRLSVPTAGPLPHAQRLPSTSPAVIKTLSKLPRPTLLSLVLEWLQDDNQATCAPYLLADGQDQEDEMYPASNNLEELREEYHELQSRKGGKKDLVARLVEGDWRRGITLYQLATADIRYLIEHPSSLKWTALKLHRVSEGGQVPQKSSGDSNTFGLPRFHASTFVRNLQREIGSIVKAHYYIERPKSLPLTLLRVVVCDTPYSNLPSLNHFSGDFGSKSGFKTIYVAFPDGVPSVYVSLGTIPGQPVGGGSDSRSLREVILDALPKALSRPQARYTLKTTSLSARTLSALLALRGPGRGNAAAGGWSIFAEGSVDDSPLDHTPADLKPANDSAETEDEGVDGSVARSQGEEDGRERKRRKGLAEGRFGPSALEDDGKGIERLDVRIEDDIAVQDGRNGPSQENIEDPDDEPLVARRRRGRPSLTAAPAEPSAEPGDEPGDQSGAETRPAVQVTFQGTHIFAGIRKLVEAGIVDGERMPGWMTGEAGVSIGVIRNGRMRGNKGSGI
ncbi:MAG: hypothetical protein M1833_002844 [Piccolia ochrophora]|nr:MAG: hypothetical protein M1833_002844 [Piccolia ochrophora]